MRGQRWMVLVSGLLVSVFGTSAAQASGTIEGGTITFVGAIVEPTCNIAVDSAALNAVVNAAAANRITTRQNCSSSGDPAADNSGVYMLSVVSLTDAETDPVLKYFNNYVKASQPNQPAPQLMTQTYE